MTPQPPEPPEQTNDFSKGVHDYYASYVNNADAKSGALFALNVAIGGLLLDDIPDGCEARTLAWIAVSLHAIATGILLFGLYPRSGRAGTSPVFWGDVKNRASAKDYADEVAALTSAEVNRLYAMNNYVVAGILSRKFGAIRGALLVTAGALVFGLVSVVA